MKDEQDDNRLKQSVATAMKAGDGLIMILDNDTKEAKFFSKRLMCPTTGMAYSDPAPNTFSFNSPQGACPKCKGLGVINEIDMEKVIPQRDVSIYNGAIAPLGKYKNQMIFWQIDAVLKHYGFDLKTPMEELSDEALNEVMYGSLNTVKISKELVGTSSDYFSTYDGVVKYLRNVMENDDSANAQKWSEQFTAMRICNECHGNRLNREAL